MRTVEYTVELLVSKVVRKRVTIPVITRGGHGVSAEDRERLAARYVAISKVPGAGRDRRVEVLHIRRS